MSLVSKLFTALLFVAVVSSISVLPACTSSPSDAQGTTGACATSSDCPSDMICVRFTCVTPTTPILPDGFAIEVTPAAGTAYRRTQFLHLSVEDPLLELSLPRPVVYDAELIDRERSDQSMSAHMTISGSPRIPGREVDVSEVLLASQRTRFELIEGSYTVRFSPTDATLPAFDFSGFSVHPSAETIRKQFELPKRGCANAGGLRCYRSLFGVVTFNDDARTPLEGVQVRASSVPGSISSTSVLSDANGRYEILLPATDDTAFRVQARPAANADGTPSWAYEEIIALGAEDRTKDIKLEPTSDGATGIARFRVVGSAGEPISQAKVTLTSTTGPLAALGSDADAGSETDSGDSGNGPGSSGTLERPTSALYEVELETNTEGYAVLTGDTKTEILVMPSLYRLEVVPPDTSIYRVMSMVVDLTTVSADSTPLPIQATLGKKVLVRGSVKDEASAPLASTGLTFFPLEDTPPSAAGASTATNQDGDFSVRLEPGKFLVMVSGEASGSNASSSTSSVPLPTTFLRISVPDAPSLDLPDTFLRPGIEVHGRAMGDDLQPLENAEIEVLVTVEDRTIVIAETRTDTLGTFTVLLPGE